MIGAWAAAFVFTELVETPIYARALRGRPMSHRLLLGALASALTHPIVWWLVLVPFADHRDMGVVVAEVFAVLVEAGWLALLGVGRPLAWAVLANAASVLVGETSRALFGIP